MLYREYGFEPTVGEPASVKTAAQRKALIGKRIEWNNNGWVSKRYGIVQGSQGKNLLVSGNYEWAPDMLNVKASNPPEESGDAQ